MIVNDIGLTKDSYSNIYTADGSEIGTIYDREGHVIYYMYRDTIGDGSRVFISYGAPIKDYKIYGETMRRVRSKNLFDDATWHGVTATRGNVEEVENGFRITASSYDAYTNTYGSGVPQCSYKVLQGETYTLSWEVDDPYAYGLVYVFSGNTVGNNVLTNIAAAQRKVSFTVPSGHNAISFRLGVLSSGGSIVYTDIMLNVGSTALPYEPYYLQDGTPSPDMPVDVVGCGVRTGNLWNEDYIGINTDATYRPLFVGDGVFTLSTDFERNGNITDIFLLSGNVSSGISSDANGAYQGRNITARSVDGYITIAYRANARTGSDSLPYCKTMLSAGSTALPYEPYGYKLPLTVNGTEYPIYLGQVQTTRKIKKLVLDGTENWTYRSGDPANVFFMYLPTAKTGEVAMSNAYPYYSGTDFVDMNDKEFAIIRSNLAIRNSDYQYESQFKAYLAAQYAAGTPVTVWYVLAEPETGIVNESLMKIGDYTDTISFAQAGVTIPTVSGTNTLTVDTTVKPSEIDLTGRIKTSGYGQLLDKNLTAINDSTGMSIFIRG